MKCGACQTTSPEITVAHVRACYAKKDQVEVPGLPGVFVPANGGVQTPNAPLDNFSDQYGNWTPASQRTPQQRAYEAENGVNAWAAIRKAADQIAPYLKYKHGKAFYGRFAIKVADETTGHSVIKFYRLKKVIGGKWDGRIFVEVQASDDYHAVRSPAALRLVFGGILAANPEKAAKLYADELGECYMCGRTLTDEASRKAGIGPICQGK